tara:strand:- start:249 stop:494 length:246 start_codon:yes stop_codon:yes gene_type:complete
MASSQNLYDYFEIVFDLSVLELKEKYPNEPHRFWELKTEWLKQLSKNFEDEDITEEEFIKLMNILNEGQSGYYCLNAEMPK